MYSASSSPTLSPSSSPGLGPIDSSPTSSPWLTPLDHDLSPSPSSTTLLHPFAASTKADRRFPQYERKSSSYAPFSREFSLSTTPEKHKSTTSKAPIFSQSPERGRRAEEQRPSVNCTGYGPSSRQVNYEEQIWDDALKKPFDTGVGTVDLSNRDLTHISHSISDLSNFFNTTESSEQANASSMYRRRIFSRVKSAPAETTQGRALERSRSIFESKKDRDEIQIYLSGNQISSLPRELFSLKRMTVLSLRSNCLTWIPPEICRLTNLRELNISNNKLEFLPSEMLSMEKLEVLSLHSNPFLQEPTNSLVPGQGSPQLRISRSRSSTTRLLAERKFPSSFVSPLVLCMSSAIPPLTELCLRVLLSPMEASADATATVLSEFYGLPLHGGWTIQPHLKSVLNACVPGCINSPITLSPMKVFQHHENPSSLSDSVGIGHCPNAEHRGGVFVAHAEERFTWAKKIGKADVGVTFPLKWRGCLRGCLGFLDGSSDDEANHGSPFTTHEMTSARPLDPDVDVDMDNDEEADVMQLLSFNRHNLDMAEFEQDFES